ncbi:MAG: capsular polysaccharide biosynthesis protein [Antarcticimicrobium sp.]|uniref:capsular polysaccharide biosynthesis protein n=1 Tax=Antarcticimicrobium sp. TaxID=2824147 RepID=UPI00262E683F|nr:capsular polysaccharide biosynthesis protein [Antarcticimicrobium sp.]MDF1717080.1 capsular polysaccharide biosynthesis protein [Antarcticimicrobium sp.]
MTGPDGTAAAGGNRPRLFVYNGGFLTQRRIRRILRLSGHRLRLGLPGPEDAVAVWGASPTAHRGLAVAAKRGVAVLRVEDAFLRSLHPGRTGEPPLGLCLDWSGPHFDPTSPSDLEQLLATDPLDDSALLNRARDAIARIREAGLTKYSGFDPDGPLPEPPYVLVIDQTRGDASITSSGGNDALFREMLVFAQLEHPGMPVVIKTHPETQAGFRPGYFGPQDTNDRISLLTHSVNPWALMEGAVGVYTVSSQLGFEAIFAGHRPRVFGQPFYAGWGLTQDENPVPRRQRSLTRAQLFAAAMMLYPTWYDPYRDRLCELEGVLDTLEAQVRAWREDRNGWTASGMRLWKRRPLQAMFGQPKRMIFSDDLAKAEATGRRRMVWASRADAQEDVVRVEDGFLRSRGLGADLVPPLSLVSDDLGIYYDPRRPSRLEHLIATRAELRADQHARSERLIAALTGAGLSKYNLDGKTYDLPAGRRILVPGQVEDDASIRTGAGEVNTNLALLQAARLANPDAVIVYKPHPDVEAGLRAGGTDAESLADVIATHADPAALLAQVDEVWTMTSLMGFEALLREVPVTTLGAPFYAGWGLTRDLGDIPTRRRARPALEGLVHATLIDYPRYRDPLTALPCPVEVIVERLSTGAAPRPGMANRILSKLQGVFATYAHLWR